MNVLKKIIVVSLTLILISVILPVKANAKKPYITAKEKVCEVGDKFYVKLKGTKAVSFYIKDETVAKVNEKGKVKTKRAGKT